ncbi:MAG: hypothetical protein JXA51_05920, partial [Dehalococcoidales bacterium]|nr:hypothetical protein [Dehalococcoidales bacterium]
TVSDGNSGNNYSVTYTPVSTGAITSKGLTVSGVTADNKVYDGNTTATLNTGSAALVGVVGSDNVTLETGSAAGVFADKNIGTDKAVTVSGLSIGGDDASNYSLTQPTTNANITAKTLTVSGVTTSSKVYDGSANATLNTDSAALVGVVEGDSLILNKGSAAGAFDNKNVGTGKTVTVSGLTISGDGASNYSLTQPTTTASITARTLTVSATGVNRVYDGTTSANVTLSDNRVEDDTLTASYTSATFADKHGGTGKTVNVSGISISGDDASNYSLASTTAATTADVSAKFITVTAAADSKTYDGDNTSSGTPTITSGSLASGDNVTWTQTFDNKNVGTNKTLTPAGTVNDGNSGNNYSVTLTPVSTGAITSKALTVGGVTADNKVYSGNTTATLNTDNATLVGIVGSENVTLETGSAAGAFADKQVATAKVVTVSGLTIGGDDVAYYSLTQPTTTANITQKELTVTGITASDKVYDGNTTATINTDNATLVGAVTGDNVTLEVSSAVGIYADANVGTCKTVTISSLTLSGDDAGNYSLTQPTTTANIIASAGGGGGGAETESTNDTQQGDILATSPDATSTDTDGNELNVTGGDITVTTNEETLTVNIPVALGEGATLDSFTDPNGVTFEDNTLVITSQSAENGSHRFQIVDEDTALQSTLTIKTGEATGTGTSAVAEVLSISADAEFTTRDFTSVDSLLGEVASTVALDLNTLPVDAEVKITTSLEPDTEAQSAFQLAAANAGMESIDIAYVINIAKTNLENGTDIKSASIIMKAGAEWVEAHGGQDAISIFRHDAETGTTQRLETMFLGYDEQGRAVFKGVSPDGLSVFGLVGRIVQSGKAVVSTPTATPEQVEEVAGLTTFTVSNLRVTPSQVMNGEVVTITADVVNTGDVEGSYTVVLKINGIVETDSEVTLNSGARQQVSSSISRNIAGTYNVDVNGLTDSFTVRVEEAPATSPPAISVSSPPTAPFNWRLIVGIIAGVIIVAGLVVFLSTRRETWREGLGRKINLIWVTLGKILPGVMILSLFLSRRGSKLTGLLDRKVKLIWSQLSGIISR